LSGRLAVTSPSSVPVYGTDVAVLVIHAKVTLYRS